MKRLFGTDGIRGVAGEAPLDGATVRKFGAALGELLGRPGATPRVLLGRDTRESGPWLRDAVAIGLESAGVEAVDAGLISTPGLASCLTHDGFDAGVMISASHNPYRDNGLKVFGSDGMKLSDERERQLEAAILDGHLVDPGDRPVTVAVDSELVEHYIRILDGCLSDPDRFRGRRVVLDCANGSATTIAPEAFRRAGAEVDTLGDQPNGTNINLDCGSLHLEQLGERVRELGFDIGFAFDGDADRCLAVDRRGRVIDGDHVLYIAGRALKRRGQLHGDGVVATIMSNFWLEERLGREGITLHRAAVGDKYVLQRMLEEGLTLGGEQSGHVIFRDHATTGDGVLTALLLYDMLLDEREPLETILDGIVPYPQVLLNVPVREKPELRSHPAIGPVVAEVERLLKGAGRVVLRYSGTERLTRVMVEGRDPTLVEAQARRLADAISSEIG